MIETLRQKSVYEEVKATDSEMFTQWFNYAIRFGTCINRKHFTKECAERKMGEVGLDPAKVEKRLKDSFEKSGDYDSDNIYLRDDRNWAS